MVRTGASSQESARDMAELPSRGKLEWRQESGCRQGGFTCAGRLVPVPTVYERQRRSLPDDGEAGEACQCNTRCNDD